MQSLILFFLVHITYIQVAASTCYTPDGKSHDDEGSAPCSSDPNDPLSTICCHTQWKNPPGGDIAYGSTADECLPNGMCQNRGFSSINGSEQDPWIRYYRVYCTHQDWKSGACLDLCDAGGSAHDGAQMMPCDGTNSSEKWCCGNTTSCCAPAFNPNAVTVAQLFTGLATSLSTLLPSHSSSTAEPTSSPFDAAVSPSSDLTVGAKAAIGVSIVIGVAAIFGLGFYVAAKHFRRKGSTLAPADTAAASVVDLDRIPQIYEMDASKLHELEVWSSHELDGNIPVVDVDGSNRYQPRSIGPPRRQASSL